METILTYKRYNLRTSKEIRLIVNLIFYIRTIKI